MTGGGVARHTATSSVSDVIDVDTTQTIRVVFTPTLSETIRDVGIMCEGELSTMKFKARQRQDYISDEHLLCYSMGRGKREFHEELVCFEFGSICLITGSENICVTYRVYLVLTS